MYFASAIGHGGGEYSCGQISTRCNRTNPELCTLAVFLLAIEDQGGELQGEHSHQ